MTCKNYEKQLAALKFQTEAKRGFALLATIRKNKQQQKTSKSVLKI